MKTNLKIGTIVLLVTMFVFSACKKEVNSEEETTSTEMDGVAADNALAENTSTELETMGDEAAKGKLSFTSYTSNCVVLTYDTINSLNTINVDFGATNCLCNDNKYRRGKVIFSYNEGSYFDEGKIISVATENFFVNDNQIIGSKTITNLGNFTHHIIANWELIKASNGGSITWNSDRTKVQTGGLETPYFFYDDTYEVSGSVSGVNAKGKNYSMSTQTSLVKEIACKWVKAGILNITVGNKSGSVDFGNGTCDDKAIVTRNGESKEITMK